MTSRPRSSTSYDVRIWTVRTYKRRKRTTYGVPWIVAGASHHQTFVTFPLADSFRSDLVSAARRGEAFDVRRLVRRPTDVEADVPVLGPAEGVQPLTECPEARPGGFIVRRAEQEDADPL